MYFLVTIFLWIALISGVIFCLRRRKFIQKIDAMTCEEKCRLLNEISSPYGYAYLPGQDLFTTTPNPWQRQFGYQGAFDRAAPWLGMVFDCEPVFFDYQGRTWMIEFWKGQYGINTGAEVGLYHADTLLPKNERRMAHYACAADSEIFPVSMKLYTRKGMLAERTSVSFWLTSFSMGCFHQPSELRMDVALTFPCVEMQEAFLEAMYEMGYSRGHFSVCGSRTAFSFSMPHTPEPGFFPLQCIAKAWTQKSNRVLCKLYLFVTRPFCTNADRLLYLYFHLPFAFQKTLRLHRFPRRCRRNCT
ncbi:MAG: DUF4474 domain-containing protein [Eubacteriales bacterium]|nr:DUF4474 domain-containing protein [Eubacteriales bacterium]